MSEEEEDTNNNGDINGNSGEMPDQNRVVQEARLAAANANNNTAQREEQNSRQNSD